MVLTNKFDIKIHLITHIGLWIKYESYLNKYPLSQQEQITDYHLIEITHVVTYEEVSVYNGCGKKSTSYQNLMVNTSEWSLQMNRQAHHN